MASFDLLRVRNKRALAARLRLEADVDVARQQQQQPRPIPREAVEPEGVRQPGGRGRPLGDALGIRPVAKRGRFTRLPPIGL